MAELKQIRNGTPTRKVAANPRKRKAGSKRRKRNPVTAAKVTRSASNPVARKVVRKRSNPVRVVANKRRKKRSKRHNGGFLAQNGFFGDTKETSKSVISLLLGLIGTKIEGSIFTPLAARALAPIGLSGFAQPAVEGVFAVTVNQWVANKVSRGSGKYVMIGGVAMATMSLVQALLPQTSVYNPFAQGNVAPLALMPPSSVNASQAAQAAGNVTRSNAAKLSGVYNTRPFAASPYSARVVGMPRFS